MEKLNSQFKNRELQNNQNNSYYNNNFDSRIENAISNKNSKSKTYLGNVNQAIANKIKSLLGINVNDRKHVLSDNDIKHMMNQYGNPMVEALKGQIAITKEDIKNIPNIINNPDNKVKGTDNKQGKTIKYIKKYNDNNTYVIEVVPNNINALIIKTMWKKPFTLTNILAVISFGLSKYLFNLSNLSVIYSFIALVTNILSPLILYIILSLLT